MRIEIGDAPRRALHFRFTKGSSPVDHLPLQVCFINHVVVHNTKRSDSRRCKIQPKRRTQPTGTDEENAGGFEFALPLEANLGQDEMATVALQFLAREFGLAHVHVCYFDEWGLSTVTLSRQFARSCRA